MRTGLRRRSRRKTTDLAHTEASSTTSVNEKRAAGKPNKSTYNGSKRLPTHKSVSNKTGITQSLKQGHAGS